MEVSIKTIPEFDRRAKRLAKKYKSLKSDLQQTYEVTLLTIYDKSEISNVTDAYTKELIRQAIEG